MSLFGGISDIFSNVANLAVTSMTGNPLLGQLAGSFVSSILNEGGGSGSASFNDIFNSAWSNSFLNAVRG